MVDIGQTVKEIGSTAAVKLMESPKTLALVETLGTLPPPTTDAGKASLQQMTDSLKAAIKNDPTLIDHLESGLTPALSDRIVNLAKTHPEKLQELFPQLKNVNNQQDLTGLLDIAEKPAPTPVATPTPTAKPTAKPTPTPTSTATPVATHTATPTPPVEPAAQALEILGKFGKRPDFTAFVQNLQTNHPELADALGLGANSSAKPDPKRLAALLPALKKLEAAAGAPDSNYFKTLSDQLDAAKKDSPQVYAQIVDTAKNHPEKLGDTIESAQSQFNMMSGIQDMGNKIGSYLGFGHLGDMLAGLFKWIIGIPIIGPMIGGLIGNLAGSLGNLFGSAQNGDLQGTSNTNFSLAHETIPGTVQDANNQRTYTLKGKMDGDQTKELVGLLAKDNAADTYNYDKTTDATTVRTTTNFKMPVAP